MLKYKKAMKSVLLVIAPQPICNPNLAQKQKSNCQRSLLEVVVL